MAEGLKVLRCVCLLALVFGQTPSLPATYPAHIQEGLTLAGVAALLEKPSDFRDHGIAGGITVLANKNRICF